jgi:hypothetical protein
MISLQPQNKYCVPLETAGVDKTVFPNGSIYLTLADSLGDFLADQDFAELFTRKDKNALRLNDCLVRLCRRGPIRQIAFNGDESLHSFPSESESHVLILDYAATCGPL